MSNQVDLTPATPPGIQAHVPTGHSASEFNNPTDNPTHPQQQTCLLVEKS
jgi:hypothetical protein